MMSNTSDERLIVAAVKGGDSEALEELKERAIFGKYGIRAILKRKQWQFSDEEIKSLEEKILDRISNTLPSYSYQVTFQIWVFVITIDRVALYKKNNAEETIDNTQNEVDQSKVPPINSHTPEKPKHPPLEQIDFEIRPLVSLLNQSSDIQTFTSCSGHPDQKVWERKRRWVQNGGWIGISSTGDPRSALDFLVSMLARLDNTHALNTTETISTDEIHERYKQADAEALFCSGGPIVLVDVSLRFFASHREVEQRLQIWKQFITCIKELIPDNEEITTEVDTPEMAAQLMQNVLHRSPFLYSVRLETSREGFLGIAMKTIADLPLLRWYSMLSKRLHEHLDAAEHVLPPDTQQNTPFTMKWSFRLRPFLNQELMPLPHLLTPQWDPRTREDHLKIWQLLELAVAEQLESENIMVMTKNI